jgi:hypothetical protein
MCVMSASVSRAEEPPALAPPSEATLNHPGPPPEALKHYARGRAHYQAGRYREAVVELEKALALDPQSPNLVYNVARVYELLGDIERSIEFYERYQRMLPATEHEERQRVEATLLRLRGAKQHVVPGATAEAPAPSPAMKRGVADTAFWLTLGTGAAAVVAGAMTGGFALKTGKETEDFVLGRDGSVGERNDLVGRTERLALASDVLFLCGATFAVSSVLLYTLRRQPVEGDGDDDATSFGFGATATGVFVGVRGTL